MQYESSKVSKITLRVSDPVGISSTQHGANLDTLGFNLNFIAQRNPKLAIEIIKLWRQAGALRADEPRSPDEDYALVEAELQQLIGAPADGSIYAR
jgi:hypothetical protein